MYIPFIGNFVHQTEFDRLQHEVDQLENIHTQLINAEVKCQMLEQLNQQQHEHVLELHEQLQHYRRLAIIGWSLLPLAITTFITLIIAIWSGY